jgi:predicted DNA-binding protein/ribosomal protein L37AE/L43A
MGTKRTYSVRLEDDQRQQLEDRAAKIGLPAGHLIRTAIEDFLRQQEEKDYLGEIQAAISTSFTKLARQVEKDRAEQQLVVGVLDHLCDWLAFVLPSPANKIEAEELRHERREVFYRELPKKFASQSRAQLTKFIEEKDAKPTFCPVCGTGQLRSKADRKGRLFWYCSNWNAALHQCGATFPDDLGSPVLQAHSIG